MPLEPPFSLSDVRRRQRRASPLLLLALAACVASIFGVIGLVRPLMVAKSDWYGLLVVAYLIPCFAIYGWAWIMIYRWFGLSCPNCGATFVHIDASSGDEKNNDGMCSRCRQPLIDLEA